jgi:phage terminase Nu1 subunit (DNA packaging protein)
MTDKKPNPSRYMSVSAIASLLGKERSTVTRWIEQEGAPVVSRPEGGSTAAYEIDPPAFVEWMVGREAERRVQKLLKERAKDVAPGDGISPKEWTEGTSKRFRAVYIALREKLRYEQEIAKVVEAEVIQATVAEEYASLRAVLASIPARLRKRGIAKAVIDMVMVVINEALDRLHADQVDYAADVIGGDKCPTPPLS